MKNLYPAKKFSKLMIDCFLLTIAYRMRWGFLNKEILLNSSSILINIYKNYYFSYYAFAHQEMYLLIGVPSTLISRVGTKSMGVVFTHADMHYKRMQKAYLAYKIVTFVYLLWKNTNSVYHWLEMKLCFEM